MDEQMIRIALAGLPLGPVRYFDSLGSTNDEAARWIEQGAPDLALVIADEQTQGRGRVGRQWFTPPGAALAFSLVLRFTKVDQPGWLVARLTALGALSASDALSLDYGLPAQIKWPNDVLINRRKAAGVLSEAYWQGDQFIAAVLGIGVNVTRRAVPPADEVIYQATSVEGEAGCPVDRLELLKSILSYLENRLAFRGDWVQMLEGGKTIEGRVVRLNEDGSLRLITRDGQEISIYAGDLRLRPLR
jgi:BirA family biotin operon repressor/biotin-[acetyl-CoA-carboxylase] ligase